MGTIEIVVTVGLVFWLLGLRVVPEGHRMIVWRRGRFFGVVGPGLMWIVLLIDKTRRIHLDSEIPNWGSLTKEQLAEEIARRAGATMRYSA